VSSVAGLGGGDAWVTVIFPGSFLHQYGNQQFKEHDHGLKQGASLR
jgi:hypothetical protein